MRNFRTSANRQYTRIFSTSSNKQYARSSSTSASNSSAYEYQQTTVNLNSINLRLPYLLSINTPSTQLTGQVTLDGEVIKRLKSISTQINLSPYLSIGKHKIEISANYSPGSSGITVELSGPDTAITQQTSGSGVLRHTLTILVT